MAWTRLCGSPAALRILPTRPSRAAGRSAAVPLAEDEIAVFPLIVGRDPLEELCVPVLAEHVG